MSRKAKKCPFCGNQPQMWEDVLVYVRCETDGCPSRTMDRSGVSLRDWNIRHEPKHETVEQEKKPESNSDEIRKAFEEIKDDCNIISEFYYDDEYIAKEYASDIMDNVDTILSAITR